MLLVQDSRHWRLDRHLLPVGDFHAFRSAFRALLPPAPRAIAAAPAPARAAFPARDRHFDAVTGGWGDGVGAATILAAELMMLWALFAPV